VEFGDIGPGALCSYREVPHGVGPYAAFVFTMDGVPVRQNVADFVGWRPISGNTFTYRVRVESGRTGPFLRLTAVTTDR
jgi:hypothetical protein